MLYGPIRIILATLILLPFILSTKIMEKLKSKRGVYIVAICCSILTLSLFLYQVPFENQFGGFKTIERAIEYKYGKCELYYTIENDGSVLVLTNKTSEILFKKNDRFYLISPTFSTRKDAVASGVHVMIYGNTRKPDRFIQVAFIWNKIPRTITDNKGTNFEKGFVNQGITYFIGSFKDDDLAYELCFDGVKVDLVEVN